MANIKPVRIQRKRIKGWKMPENTVIVSRGTKWGNPFKIDKFNSREKVLKFYKIMLNKEYSYWRDIVKKELKGKNLACYCKLSDPCHADILLKIANS